MPESLTESPKFVADQYLLTTAQSYFRQGLSVPATFSLFVRENSTTRGYLVAAGLEDVIRHLEEFRFTDDLIHYLRSTGLFQEAFLTYLKSMRFTGNIRAISEGRVFFPGEPILEVTAPIIEAQMAETLILNQMNLQTMIATKASRCVWAARGRRLVDFSLRRAHGTDAGMKTARASYMVGFEATSNVLAGQFYGVPLAGTMSHAFVSSFEHEIDAFRAFAESFPDQSIFLIDTYDSIAGTQKAIIVAREMQESGHRLLGVRLDSGDLKEESRQIRMMLSEAGLAHVEIFVSGGLDEFLVEDLVENDAHIDAFGVGTKMGVSADAPWLDMVYKLVEFNGRPILKLTAGKTTLVSEKQVYRIYGDDGLLIKDVIALRSETPPVNAEPLLHEVMATGKAIRRNPPLTEIRECFRGEISRLSPDVKKLTDPTRFTVEMSDGLQAAQLRTQRQVIARELATTPPLS